MIVRPDSRIVSAISFGVFWRDGALDQRDHAVEEGLTRVCRDADDELIRQHLGAAGHRGAVATRLPDDGSRFAGDRRLVHRGHAVDDLAVSRDEVTRRAEDQVADLERAGGHGLEIARVRLAPQLLRLGLPAGLPQRVRLSLAPAFGHRLGEVREQDGEPEPQGQLEDEPGLRGPPDQVPDQHDGGEHTADQRPRT